MNSIISPAIVKIHDMKAFFSMVREVLIGHKIDPSWAQKGMHTIWNIRCFDKDGNLKWEEGGARNIFHDEGEQFILEVTFSEAQTVPVTYYIGLDDRAALAEGDVLPPANEPSGNGYARQPVTSDATDWTVSQDVGDYQAKSKTVQFTASGGPIPVAGVVDNMFLSTTLNDTGKLVASVALSTSRTIADGDNLQTDITIKVSE